MAENTPMRRALVRFVVTLSKACSYLKVLVIYFGRSWLYSLTKIDKNENQYSTSIV